MPACRGSETAQATLVESPGQRDSESFTLYFVYMSNRDVVDTSIDGQPRWVSDAMATQLERPTGQNGDPDDVGRSLLDELMTPSQVAALLQMRLSTIESYARRGLLPSVKVGRHRRFIRSQLDRTIDTLTNGQEPRRKRVARAETDPDVDPDG